MSEPSLLIVEEFLKDFIELSGKNVGEIGLWVFKYNEDLEMLEHWEIVHLPSRNIDEETKCDIENAKIYYGQGSIGCSVDSKKPIIIDDTSADPRGVVSRIDQQIGQRSALCYPIMEGKKIICVLDFFSDKQNMFDNGDEVAANILLGKYKYQFIWQHEIQQNRRREDLLTKSIDIPKTSSDLAQKVQEYLNQVLPVSVIFYQEKDKNTYNTLSYKTLEDHTYVNVEFAKSKILRELEWCSYQKSANCEMCSVKSVFSPCFLKQSSASEIGNIPINDDFKLLYYPVDVSDHTLILENIKNELVKQIKEISYNALQDYGIVKRYDESISLSLEKQLSSNEDNLQLLEKLSFLTLLKKNQNGFVFKDTNSLTPKQISSLKYPSSIRAIYHGFRDGRIIEKYEPLIKISDKCTTINIVNETVTIDEHSWHWEKGEHNKIIYSYLNDNFIKNKLITLSKDLLDSKKGVPIMLQDLLDVVYANKLEISAFQDEHKFIIYYRGEREEDLLYIKTFISHICNLYNAKMERDKAIKHANKAAIASIMGRNMSHNIGSHVLSSLKEESLKNTHEVSDFHSYLQKRMDLLARITGDKPDWGEPMFFVEDLLKGFFSQTLLLNNLVADQGGWKVDKIQFVAKIPNSNGSQAEITFKYCSEREDPQDPKSLNINKWRPCNNTNGQDTWGWDGYEDFLVSIPDGVIGAQAFYIFMESMIRNSAKYGKSEERSKANATFTIHIDVEDKGSHYKLRIWDNLSTCDGKLASDIQEKIKEDLIDDTGALCSTSLGIAEMREACEFLIHPHEDDFPAYSFNHGNEAQRDSKVVNYPLWVECPMPNNCTPGKNGCSHLCYTFNLAKPKMIAIIDGNLGEPPCEDSGLGIKKFENRNDLLTKKGAYQFVLFYVNKSNKDDIIKFIRDNHRKLPQRLLLVDNDSNVSDEDIAPKRRAVVCSTMDIKGSSGDLLISTYMTWIKKRWLDGNKKKVSLQISFARNKNNAIYKSWEASGGLTEGLTDLKDIIGHYNVKAKNNETEHMYDDDIVGGAMEQNSYLEIVYSNHKRIDSKGKFFYHDTGSSDKKIFETLASPPKGLMFKYFLLGLVEAGLTSIVIIDERVACSLLGGPFGPKERYEELTKKIHCYPVFYIKKNSKTEPLTKTIGAVNYYSRKVGLAYTGTTWKIENADNQNDPNMDFVVFHNGIVETIVKDLELVDKIENLYDLSPSVVITSGRGKVLKDLRDSSYPFLEFSILKDNIFPSVSKYHLVRSLMSTKGKEAGGNE